MISKPVHGPDGFTRLETEHGAWTDEPPGDPKPAEVRREVPHGRIVSAKRMNRSVLSSLGELIQWLDTRSKTTLRTFT